MTENIILILIGGIIGISSSLITIYLKYYLDEKKRKRQIKYDLDAHKIMSEKLLKEIPQHHPIHDLMRIKENIRKELKKNEVINSSSVELTKLFIEINDKLLNWTDRELKQIESSSRIEHKEKII